MIKSMTGYGKGIVKEGEIIVEAEIKTFNNRFQDIGIKIPKSVLDKEFQIRTQLRKSLKRGKINLSVYLKREGTEGKALFIDQNGLNTVVSLVNQVAEQGGVKKDELNVSDFLNFQSMFITDSILDAEREFELVQKAIDLAINQVMIMREKEGKELEDDLKKRLEIIEAEIEEISKIKRDTIEEYFSKLKDRAVQLFEDLNENPDRLNMELALIAERYDITEECVRLNSHIKLFKETLSNSDEIGKKLNFIIQEMNREANTINSKTISQTISHKGITIKEELEKIREQIQNIE